MYDIQKRKQFTTVEELAALISELAPSQKIFLCGQLGGYFHATADMDAICLDVDELDDEYQEE